MVAKVQDFYRVTMARRLDGAWELRGMGTLRTVRLDKRLGWPDMADSAGVVGRGRYRPRAATSPCRGRTRATLALSAATGPAMPHLVSANATVQSWSVDRGAGDASG